MHFHLAHIADIVVVPLDIVVRMAAALAVADTDYIADIVGTVLAVELDTVVPVADYTHCTVLVVELEPLEPLDTVGIADIAALAVVLQADYTHCTVLVVELELEPLDTVGIADTVDIAVAVAVAGTVVAVAVVLADSLHHNYCCLATVSVATLSAAKALPAISSVAQTSVSVAVYRAAAGIDCNHLAVLAHIAVLGFVAAPLVSFSEDRF